MGSSAGCSDGTCRYAIYVGNENAITDDNFAVILNGSQIATVIETDLSCQTTTCRGTLVLPSSVSGLPGPCIIGQNVSPCIGQSMNLKYLYADALDNPPCSNTVQLNSIQNNGCGNFGVFRIYRVCVGNAPSTSSSAASGTSSASIGSGSSTGSSQWFAPCPGNSPIVLTPVLDSTYSTTNTYTFSNSCCSSSGSSSSSSPSSSLAGSSAITGTCAGSCGYTGNLFLTVSGCTCPSNSVYGTFSLTYQGGNSWLDTTGIANPCGQTGNMNYSASYDPVSKCYSFSYGGACGTFSTSGGNVLSCAPVHIEFDHCSQSCNSCSSTITATLTQ